MLPIFLFFIALFFPRTVLATPLYSTASATVTATVPSAFDLPVAPILISPQNQGTISTTTPTFIFEPSLGTIGVSHYQLWIDGAKNTDHIPQSLLTITTQALSPLSQGQHTWVIKAIATNSTHQDSAAWTFTIDTTAPLIIINHIAQNNTNLSSLDYSTFSSISNLTTSDRYPAFAGTGEANASLTISLTGSTNSTTFSTTINPDTSFTLKPQVALSPDNYTVSISSTDASGNTTSLPSFILTITPPSSISWTLPLPSPLPDITISLPPFQLRPIPPLPQALTAYPISSPAASYLPWLLVFLFMIFILTQKTLFLFVNLSILIYLSLTAPHWLVFSLTGLLALIILILSSKNSKLPKKPWPHRL